MRVKDLWHAEVPDPADPERRVKVRTAKHPANGGNKDAKRWLACWVDPLGRERTKAFAQKERARAHAVKQESAVQRGEYVDPREARTTVRAWNATWIKGYATRRASTVRQAKTHIAQIDAEFGDLPLAAVRPSQVKSWCARLKEGGAADSYVYALHARLSQIMSDAVLDGVLVKSPCSRRTSPGAGKQRPYVASEAAVWALWDAMPERYRIAVTLGACAGLRLAEACGLRTQADIDYLRYVINPAVQYPAQELKTETSRTAIPVPKTMIEEFAAHAAAGFAGETLLTDDDGEQVGPWKLERAFRKARAKVRAEAERARRQGREAPDIPAEFRFQDLRHFFASFLIASGADVKVVQARLRHASAKTTLDTYGHLWPDRDESTRSAVDTVLKARAERGRNRKEAR